MTELPDVLGVIYPMSGKIIYRIFRESKRVFAKFTTHEPTKKTKVRLKPGVKLYFYQTRRGNIIVGEGRITNFEYLLKSEIEEKYSSELAINETELDEYSKGRESKKLLTISFVDVKKYAKPIPLEKPITMAGMYITKENKKEILG